MGMLTVIFSGLMIFDTANGVVYPLSAADHKLVVTVNRMKQYPKDASSIVFRDLQAGQKPTFVAFPILDVNHLSSVSVSLKDQLPGVRLTGGGGLRGWGESDVCGTPAGRKESWEKVLWQVGVGAKPGISVDGGGSFIDLKPTDTVEISNDYTGTPTSSHVPMYAAALKPKSGVGSVTVAQCAPGPFSVGTLVRDPITCPPVRLQ